MKEQEQNNDSLNITVNPPFEYLKEKYNLDYNNYRILSMEIHKYSVSAANEFAKVISEKSNDILIHFFYDYLLSLIVSNHLEYFQNKNQDIYSAIIDGMHLEYYGNVSDQEVHSVLQLWSTKDRCFLNTNFKLLKEGNINLIVNIAVFCGGKTSLGATEGLKYSQSLIDILKLKKNLIELFFNKTEVKEEESIQKIISANQIKIDKEYKPLGDISLAIIKSAHNCFETIKQLIETTNNKEKQELEIYLFYELIYFFMHLTNRIAFLELNSQQIRKLQEYIGPIITETAIDSFFKHWPEDLKSKMYSEFYENINKAEYEYSESKELISNEKPFTSNSLFSMLSRNIAELLEKPFNIATFTIIFSTTTKEFSEMKLAELIKLAAL